MSNIISRNKMVDKLVGRVIDSATIDDGEIVFYFEDGTSLSVVYPEKELVMYFDTEHITYTTE